VSQPPEDAVTLLDVTVADVIDALGADVARSIWQAAAEDLPQLATNLSAALTAGDLRRVERVAHAGKGSSGSIGLSALSDGFALVLAWARSGDVAAARVAWSAMHPVFHDSVRQVAVRLQRVGGAMTAGDSPKGS
jgi:HPt (histidine-containing phosphotransfer) domain-containing protein